MNASAEATAECSGDGKTRDLFGVCPYVTSQMLLSGKWPIYILYELMSEPVRFNELLRRMPREMTHATLSRQLKEMEAKGLVVRIDHHEVPPRVEYETSAIGREFAPVLNAMAVWGEKYIAQMDRSASTPTNLLGC